MKNLPIKFRAVSDGDIEEVIFGDLIHDGKNLYVGNPCGKFFNVTRVKINSVSQLVGYDKNGNEIYEGDTVYFKSDENNHSYRVSAGTLLSECEGSVPDFVIKDGNISNFFKEN